MRPEQICLLPHLSAPSVHPDGTWAVVSMTHPDFEADDRVGQLWRIALGAGPGPTAPGTGSRRITRGFADTSPKVSPDGLLIAFLRRNQGHRPQLALMEADGGEPWIITSFTQGVNEFSWSPDSRRIVVSARVPDPGRYGTVNGINAGHEDPRHLTGLKLRHNGLGAGWYTDRPLQLFLLEVPDPEAEPAVPPAGRGAIGIPEDSLAAMASMRSLTEDHADWTSPVICPDGSVVACRETADSAMITSLVRISPDGQIDAVPGSETIETPEGIHRTSMNTVTLAGDPEDPDLLVAFADLGPDGNDPVSANTQIGLVGADGITVLTGTDLGLSSTMAPGPAGVLVTESFRGCGRLHLVSPNGDGSAPRDTLLLDVDAVARGAAQIPGSHDTVVTLVTPQSPGEVALVGPEGVTILTDFGRDLREVSPVTLPRELTATSPDGYPVHGWVLTPEGPGPHPVILMIHGGPHSQYTGSFFDEFQAMTGAGYAVVACNPRGSAGYGRDHGRALIGRFGDVDAADVMAFLEAALAAHPDLDRDRMGIMGGSYGGYLTAWIIGHDHRWRGAIVERGYLDPASFIGSSDIGWYYPDCYNGTTREQLEAQSAMRWAEQVTTPTLVIHAEQDLRAPMTQGLEYHARLTRAGVDTELLIFPGENHELSRSGTPWHRRQRLETILDFWSRHLA
ncbi:alpha/beta hydrolase family protein [Acidipropionibacterium jensenii]|uniref:alpha/beta hydrolase family protein n=2 Tax=Acidipropionibacterium jensenii TaxID=1749 RepID=UPI002649985A|nr:S9 family peptidase [Acidipropionibacterium jensenii]MDN5978315.1 S9 family peptidase [Acidipropionibacterium jensenii]MDN6592051.1 S9 family peptidase [Acidipropionibacterium jensenii]